MERLLLIASDTIHLYRFRKELINALKEHKQVFVSAEDGGFVEDLKSLGVTYIETPFNRRSTNPFQDFILFCRYFAIMRKIKPNAVLTYTIKPNVYGNFAARLLRIPVISTVSGLGDGFINQGLVGDIVKFLYRMAFQKVSAVVFENDDDEQVMKQAKIIKTQKTIVVPGSGVNLKEHTVLEYPKNPKISFLYIGRIVYSKGIYELIEATRKLKSEYDFTVNLMGFNEEDAEKLIGQAQKDKIVSVLGFQTNIVPFIEKAHCIVLPSYREGMSNALLEGAASGRALIATNIPGCREVVDDGVNGFLCEPRDVGSLYEAMKKFINLSLEEKAQMGEASRKKAEKDFSRDIVVNTIIDEVNSIDEINSID